MAQPVRPLQFKVQPGLRHAAMGISIHPKMHTYNVSCSHPNATPGYLDQFHSSVEVWAVLDIPYPTWDAPELLFVIDRLRTRLQAELRVYMHLRYHLP